MKSFIIDDVMTCVLAGIVVFMLLAVALMYDNHKPVVMDITPVYQVCDDELLEMIYSPAVNVLCRG
jgi:hypothetical protein